MKRIAVLLIISSAFLSACTSANWTRTPVAKEYDFNVTLEQPGNAENGSRKYEHPYEIGVAELEKLMADLTYTEKAGLQGTAKQNPVFQATEIVRMAPVLTEALAKAEASQRIRFTSFNLGKAALFSISQKTEGVLFIASDGRLNIAFVYINSKRSPSETSAVYHSHAKIEPLTIRASETTIAAMAPYAERHAFATGEQAPMWIVADLDKLKEATTAETISIAEATEKVASDNRATEESRLASPDTPAAKTASVQAVEEPLKKDIKDKLRFLKELMDEGLISEQDYNHKKVELLDRID